ncbi:damage-control phosphatase ARMT1 family protein [Streptomyces sp. NPDC050560]|uniref:damage-control phosphatase ARMT1 family protein n=1 Tax=Streptomyces sp. NPDC050560 TaxID=3365630 RepID=UPI0037A3FCC5
MPDSPAAEAPAPVITSDAPGSFPMSVLAERHPKLVRQVYDAFPYGPGQRRALDMLVRECEDGVVEPLGAGAADRDLWAGWGRGMFGRSWYDVPFLWAESYFYRRLLGAVGYFDDGPWHGVDPFAPFKRAELNTPEAQEELAAPDRLASHSVRDQNRALLQGSLWGNRADLGFRLSGSGEPGTGAGGPLVADDSDALWSLLPPGGAHRVCLVADNAGRELVPDLLLVDQLVRHGHAEHVVLLVKPYPYYVSDATTADFVDCLRHLAGADGAAGAAGRRLWELVGRGRVEVRTHPFFCAPFPYEDMPDDLREEFGRGTLTVMKGDLNYRRLVGDRSWSPTTPFAACTAYFPGPVAALRTLKSDVVTGLDTATVTALDERHGGRWRTGGTHALIQVRA